MSDIDFRGLVVTVLRALLTTTEKFERRAVVKGVSTLVTERMSDQARRVALLICAETFGEGREGFYARSQAAVAEALSMDTTDFSLALKKLEGWGLLVKEEKDDGLWLQLVPSRLTLDDRAVKASRAFARIEHRPDPRQLQLPGVARSRDERRDAGFREALAEADLEEASRAGKVWGVSPQVVGSFPMAEPKEHGEFPHEVWGVSPQSVGSFPMKCGEFPHAKSACIDMSRARPRGSSPEKHLPILEDRTSGAVARDKSSAAAPEVVRSRQFADLDKRLCWEQMEAIDPSLKEPGRRRGAWINRVSDCPREIFQALGIVRDEKLTGDKAMKRLYTCAREFAKAAGKTMRTVVLGWTL